MSRQQSAAPQPILYMLLTFYLNFLLCLLFGRRFFFLESNRDMLSSPTALLNSGSFSSGPLSISELPFSPFLLRKIISLTSFAERENILLKLERSYENHIFPVRISVFTKNASPSISCRGSNTLGSFD